MYTVFQLSKRDHKACVGNHKFQCLEHAIDLFEAFTLENTPAELVGEGKILYVNYPNKSENNSDDGLTRLSGFEIVEPSKDTKETEGNKSCSSSIWFTLVLLLGLVTLVLKQL